MPKWTGVTVCLMVSFAVSAFEDMRTWLTFGGCSVEVLVLFATPHIFSVMFSSVCSIALCASGHMRVTTKYWVPPFPTVLALWNAQVHISATDCGNISSNIEVLVDNVLHCQPTLQVPDINPNYCHIRFGWGFDNARLWCQSDVVENVCLFDDTLDDVRSNRTLLSHERKSNDLQVQFRLR